MTALRNEIIRASAGSGKTWCLVRRYLWLLAQGAEPERIAAMTFTRKAAGEFFERILQRLAEIAEDPSSAKDYVDELGGGQALVLLRKMLRRMDRLRLGTIDSFFATMAQCLPFELGLTGQSSLMSEEDAMLAREDVLDELLLAVTRLQRKDALDELREAWKAASRGSEQNRPAETLLKWIGQLHHLFIECPERSCWGGENRIWPAGNDKLALATADLPALVDRLEGVLDLGAFGKQAVKKWGDFLEEARSLPESFRVGDSAIEYMLDEKRGVHADLRRGGAGWMMWKAAELDAKTGAALADVLDAIVGRALRIHGRRTAAQFEVLRLYEGIYHRLVRTAGRLMFSDLGWLLSGRLRSNGAESGDWRGQWESMRAALEFRMDSRYDHWLLDEFQDTSERQWEVLAPLLEEARQDAEERRSVFLVGDLKQSIYLWRQAEPELFKHVERAWDDGRLNLRPLNESFRSSAEVLALVNAIFLGADAEFEARFPGVSQLWQYEEHRGAGKVAGLKGHGALLSVGEDEDGLEIEESAAVAALLLRIRPIERGLTCAVLVRKNESARSLAAELRRRLPGREVICESEEAVAVDNPATLALLSLLQLAAHPGDTRAWHHVLMTPLGPGLRKARTTAGSLGAEVRGAVAALGFLAVARAWAERLQEATGKTDPFTARRFAQFFELAAGFDETGSRDVDAFLRRAREYRVREDSAHSGAIQVMTVHQSKGLEFDVVILPELQGDALDSVARSRLFVSRGERGRVEWILDKPESSVVRHDAVLRDALRREKARAAFEGLCRLYVGVTRARLGLYLMVFEGRKNTSNNEADLLRARLGRDEPAPYDLEGCSCRCVRETGARDWHEAFPEKAASAGVTAERASAGTLGRLLREVNRVVARRTPSGEESFRVTGADLLSPGRERGRRLGTLVHDLFAGIEWYDGDAGALERRWRAEGWSEREGYGEAAELVRRALASDEVRAWFTKAQGRARREAWRERRFDMFHEGLWISGEPDRVVLEWGADGRVAGATILDFKTDTVTDEASIRTRMEGYAPQLGLYRQAVARLTGLDPGRIRSGLIFLRAGLLRWLENS